MEPKEQPKTAPAQTAPAHDAGKDAKDPHNHTKDAKDAKDAKAAVSTGNPTFDAIRYVAVRIGGHVLEQVDEILGLNDIDPPAGV